MKYCVEKQSDQNGNGVKLNNDKSKNRLSKDSKGRFSEKLGDKPFQASKFALLAKQGSKPPKKSNNESTHFKVFGRSWESKGFAIVGVTDVARMRSLRPATRDEIAEELRKREEEELRLTKETEDLRRYFHAIDDERKEREAEAKGIDEFAEEDREKRKLLLEKALLSKYEQDEMVQQANRAINDAKCHVIWGQQLHEQTIRQEYRELADREQERKNQEYHKSKFNTQEDEDERKLIMRKKFTEEVRKQMEDQRKLRFIEEELLYNEAKMVSDAQEALKLEKEREQALLVEKKTTYRNELQKSLAISSHFKRMMCEQEREDDRRAIRYLKDLEQRKAQEHELKEQQKKDFEARKEHLFTVQQKILDTRGNLQEMHYLTEKERIERTYREEERREAEKRLAAANDLRESHKRQMEEALAAKACFFTQEQKELKQHIEYVAAQLDRSEIESKQKECRGQQLRNAIAGQIESREMKRRRDVEEARYEADQRREQENQRKRDIEAVIQIKLDKVRSKDCLPKNLMDSLEGRVKAQVRTKGL